MSDTPRTDAYEFTAYASGLKLSQTCVSASFARGLERELNAANGYIKRLEQAGDAMVNGGWNEPHLAGAWREAKEAK